MPVTEIISALLQAAVFTLIPFLVYVIRKRTTKGFFRSIGFFKPSQRGVAYALLASTLIIAGGISLLFTDSRMGEILLEEPSVTGKLRAMGPGANRVIILLVIAWIKTSLAEEILFRGFVAKAVARRVGFLKGNVIQAVFFGLIHLLLFWAVSGAGPAFLLFIFTFSGLAGFVIMYINERISDGSIVPGWIAHGLGNMVAYSIIVFLI